MLKETINNLNKKGYIAKQFASRDELILEIKSHLTKTEKIGFGGSMTINDLCIPHLLKSEGYEVCSTRTSGLDYELVAKMNRTADVYFSSANAITKEGIIVNLDGRGNRVGATAFGGKKLFIIVGKNKITEDIQSAIVRVRTIAAPQNAKRLDKKTPCAVTGICSDCDCPDRICRGWFIMERPMTGKDTYVFFLEENLGF